MAFCNRTPEPETGRQWFAMAKAALCNYSLPMQYLGFFIGAAGHALFFGGNWMDCFCSGLCGMLVGLVNQFLDKRKANQFFSTIASAFFMALLAYALGDLGITENPDAVTIGALMILVPGLLFTNAMRDIIYGDTNSGMNRITLVFLIAVALALGTGAAWQFSTILFGVPTSAPDISYSLLLQILFSMIGCFGFAIQYNVHGPGVLLCTLGGGIAWAVYGTVLAAGFGDLTSYFFAALTASVYSEIMARIRKFPASSYLVISIFPLIPGAGVYYTMNHAVQGQTDLFASQGMHTAAIAGVMAVGILLGSTVFRMYSDYKSTKK